MKTEDIHTAKYYAQALADHASVLFWADNASYFHEQSMCNALAKIAKAMGYTLEPIAQDAQQAA